MAKLCVPQMQKGHFSGFVKLLQMIYKMQLSDSWQREAAIRFKRSSVNMWYARPKRGLGQGIVM